MPSPISNPEMKFTYSASSPVTRGPSSSQVHAGTPPDIRSQRRSPVW